MTHLPSCTVLTASEELPITGIFAGREARLFVGNKLLFLRLNLSLPTNGSSYWNCKKKNLCTCINSCNPLLFEWTKALPCEEPQVEMLKVSLTGCVDASGLELSGTAGVALQQADDGGVALRSFDELLQRQLT